MQAVAREQSASSIVESAKGGNELLFPLDETNDRERQK